MVSQLGCECIGKGADAHLEAVAVFYEGCAVLAYLHLGGRGFRECGGYQGLVVLHKVVESVEAYKVAVCEGDVGVDDSDYKFGILYCGIRAVDGSAKGDASFSIREGDVDKCGSEFDGSGTVKAGSLAEVYRQVVGISGVDVGTDVGADEEALVEKYPFIFGSTLGCRAFSMEMMEVEVADVSCISPAGKGPDKAVGDAGNAAEMYVAMRGDVAYGLIGTDESDIFHGGTKIVILCDISIAYSAFRPYLRMRALISGSRRPRWTYAPSCAHACR